MKQVKDVLTILLVIFCLSMAVYFFFRAQESMDQEMTEHLEIKREIIRVDSMNRIEQKRVLDSLLKRMDSLSNQVVIYDKINAKLQKQNAKLDAIYHSLNVSMPDL